MQVLRDPSPEECEKGVPLSTRSVYDWRHRGGEWRRRCRFVAREFRGYAKTTSETFAPTSGVGSRLVLLMHVCFGWCLLFCDIRDAFLLVPQQECVLVSVPTWWKPEEHVPGVESRKVLGAQPSSSRTTQGGSSIFQFPGPAPGNFGLRERSPLAQSFQTSYEAGGALLTRG